MFSPAIKAGLAGGLALIVLNLIGLLPIVGCIALILEIVAYAAVGVLAAHWMNQPREPGRAAGLGALAAVVAALIGGLARTVIMTIQLTLTDSSAVLAQLPPESLELLREAGIDPSAFTSPEVGIAAGAVCCGVALLAGAVLGALGGLIYASVRPGSHPGSGSDLTTIERF
jgi:hypothetical protein